MNDKTTLDAKIIINHLGIKIKKKSHDFVLANVFLDFFECDLFSISKSGYSNEYEVKISKADFFNDFEKRINGVGEYKHEMIKRGGRTNRFWFVTQSTLDIECPEYAGLIHCSYKPNKRLLYFQIKKEAPLLHKRKFYDNASLVRDLAHRCYSRLDAQTINNVEDVKDTQIQFRCSEQLKASIKSHCNEKDIKISNYITSLIVKDLKITPPTKELIYGVDWEL